jgi:hypothetical protein
MNIDDYDWEAFTRGAANALWADLYITEVEFLCELVRETKSAEAMEACRALSPGPGGSWDDYIPPVPRSALAEARQFTARVQEKISPQTLRELDEVMTPERAGWLAMMQALGHGIGWADEGVRAESELKIRWEPSWEVRNAAFSAVERQLEREGFDPEILQESP